MKEAGLPLLPVAAQALYVAAEDSPKTVRVVFRSVMQQERYGLLPVTSWGWGCRSCTWRLVCFVQ
jgi:hypothetical protein